MGLHDVKVKHHLRSDLAQAVYLFPESVTFRIAGRPDTGRK